MRDWGCWLDGVAQCNQISGWTHESLKLCVALYCHGEASFMLDS
jgi:hypothetical protein